MRNGLSSPPAFADDPSRGRAAGNHAGCDDGTPHGFTLIELLVVMAVITVLLLLVVPAFTQIGTARSLTKGAYDITGALEMARAYAKANSTYTWVGFFEEDPGLPTATAGTGRIVVSMVASKDGTSTYIINASSSPTPFPLNPSSLLQVGKLTKIDNVHLTVLAATDIPSREKVPQSDGTISSVPDEYQVGNNKFDGTPGPQYSAAFNYPIASSGAAPNYKFVKIIQFNPIGDATKIVDSPTRLMEIDLRPAHGSTTDAATKNCAAIQIAGIGGKVRMYRP